jgi:hypothetical protein
MTSKKPANSKRAAPPRACDYTRTFFKDWERLSRSGRYDLKRLGSALGSDTIIFSALDRSVRRWNNRHEWER